MEVYSTIWRVRVEAREDGESQSGRFAVWGKLFVSSSMTDSPSLRGAQSKQLHPAWRNNC